jgi:hypothetical protein
LRNRRSCPAGVPAASSCVNGSQESPFSLTHFITRRIVPKSRSGKFGASSPFGIPRISRWDLCARVHARLVGGGRSRLLCCPRNSQASLPVVRRVSP